MRTDARENRQRILETAAKLLHQQGFKNTTMAQIAKQADVGIGTLYRNFATKDELYLALLSDKINDYTQKEKTYLKKHSVNLATIKQVLHDYLDFREKRLLLFPPVAFESAYSYYQHANYQNLVNLFSQLFKKYKHLSPKAALFQADMLAAALRNDAYYYQRKGRHLSKDKILNRLLDLFFK